MLYGVDYVDYLGNKHNPVTVHPKNVQIYKVAMATLWLRFILNLNFYLSFPTVNTHKGDRESTISAL
jgi:hypothetical protein